MGQDIHHIYSATNKNIDMLRLLSYKSIDLEARSRRQNLIFRNIVYRRGDNCFDLVREFLDSMLNVDGNNMYLERAHLFGPVNKRNPSRRDIIVSFRDCHDTTTIMNGVGNLRDTPYFIDRDYPKEIVDARKRIWPKYKAARAESIQTRATVRIQFPAKLVVDGRVIHDEFPYWSETMRGTRDRGFGHIHCVNSQRDHSEFANNAQSDQARRPTTQQRPTVSATHITPYLVTHSNVKQCY